MCQKPLYDVWMFRKLGTICLLWLIPACGFSQEREISELAAKLRDQIVKFQKKTIAILEISNNDYRSDFSDYVIDELTNGLVSGGPGFRVVTRARLSQLLKEKNLKYSSGFDDATFKKIGQFSGADAIVAGSYKVLGSSIRLNLQVLDVSDGTVIASASANLAKTPDVDRMLIPSAPASRGPEPGDPGVPPGTTPPQKFTPMTVELGGTRFVLNGCRALTSRLICDLVVIRIEKDRDFRVYWDSRFIDANGNEYSRPTVSIGGTSGHSLKGGGWVEGNLIKDVPTKLRIEFDEVGSGVKRVEVLEVHGYEGKVQFRKIQL